MHYFGVPNVRKMFYHERVQSNLLDPKQCLGLFPSILQNFATKKSCKTCISGLKALFRGFKLLTKVFPRTPPMQPVRPKMMFGSVSVYFTMVHHEKSCKTCVSGLNALFLPTELPKFFCYEHIQSNLLDLK